MNLRELERGDHRAVAELIELYDREQWRRPYPTGEWKDEYLDGWLGFVGEDGGRIVAVALGSLDPHGTGGVHLVYVREELRRRGLAKQLLALLVARFRELGASWVTLNVDTTNEAALAIWRRLGFVEDSLHLNTPLDRLAERLEPRDAAPSYASIHVQSDDERSIERAAIITGSVVASAASSVPAPRPASTTTSVLFLPNMSPRRPAMGVATDAARR